ncbi:MAG: mechanosensitive ion channel family protein [Actinotalea sp.]|nr:mechanosensitive ion channel family protein [Actinotalea sp.]
MPALAASAVGDVTDTLSRWLTSTPARTLVQTVVAILVGVLVLAVARWSIARTVRSVVEGGTTVRRHARRLLLRTRVAGVVAESSALAVARRVQRAETMGSVLRSTAALVVGIGVLTAIANINGWDLAPVLASAGVAGVALGFGAQTLVKDFLSGIFMLVEDQYGVGDVVDLGEASGTVEAIGLRVTQVRDLKGTLWYVRNGEILRVGNKTQGWSRAIVEIRVGPDQDIDQAMALLQAAVATTALDETLSPHLLGEPEVTAFEELTGESVLLRAAIKTAPAKQWDVQRVLRARIKETFTAQGVPLAVPRREVLVEREPATGAGKGHDASTNA